MPRRCVGDRVMTQSERNKRRAQRIKRMEDVLTAIEDPRRVRTIEEARRHAAEALSPDGLYAPKEG